MEAMSVKPLAQKMGITSEFIIKKAEEFMRLVDVKACSSSVHPTGTFKAAICLDLAAASAGQPIDKNSAVRLSGVNKNIYTNGHRSLECILDLRPKVTIPDLAIQFGCETARIPAIEILTSYQATCADKEMATSPLFLTAALFSACKKLKMKIDKKKLAEQSGVKKSIFDKLVTQMDKHADNVLAKTTGKQEKKGKRSKTFLEGLEDMPDEPAGGKKQCEDKISTDEQPEEEDYEEWKEKILEQAYKALGRKRQTSSN